MLRFSAHPDDDPPPFYSIAGDLASGFLLICDHASARVPRSLNGLGLGPEELQAHIAWDIGAEQVTRLLARRFGCPAVVAGVSRLVVDCNRHPGDPSSIPALTGGVAVPGNQNVDEDQAALRAQKWFWPYHMEISRTLERMLRRGPVPAIFSVHSFTPCLGDRPRPWHVGILANRDTRMSEPLLRRLTARGDLCVGDNQPYSGREINYTLDTHAGAAGLPHASVEIRQDLIADPAGCALWADILAQALEPVLQAPDLHRACVF